MYRAHRERLLKLLAKDQSAGLFFSGRAPIRNNDCQYRFRPDSDFWYLTGFDEPDAVLLLAPGGEQPETVMFLRERKREEEIWNGLRLGVEDAPETLGVAQAYPIHELWERLPDLLEGHRRVIYRSGENEARDREVFKLGSILRARVRAGVEAPLEWVDPTELVSELRLIKSAGEVDCMRRAAAISAEAHVAAMAQTEPGRNEAELDAMLDYVFRARGGTGAAYSNIVAGGSNACILHYIENNQPLVDGDLLLIDAGAEWDYYASDVTRTFPVNGTFDPEQRALYEVVLDAQLAAIQQCRPGKTFQSVHDIATMQLVTGLVGLGLLAGPVEQALEQETYRRFYMHKTGHWLGLDVHDCGVYHVEGKSRVFEPGMVTTVEPGLYVAEDDDTVEERWRGIGIRIEDDILITKDGNEVLTAAIPKSIKEVEAACRHSSTLQPVS